MAPKTKSTAANGANGASQKQKSATPSGTSSPATVPAEVQEFTPVAYGPGRPDKAQYDAEQNKIKAEIDALQVKLNAVRDKLNVGKGGPGNERRNALRAELDTIRGQQSTSKLARGKVFEQLKTLQEGIQKKIKDLNAQKAKIPYKSVSEVDDRIRHKQVESGNLKLVDEKRALQEISQAKRSRRIVEGFQADQDAIEADRTKADEIRAQLDDPEAKAASERYDAIKAELDELKKEGDEAHASRSKLLDERTAIQGQLDELWTRKRESASRYKEANDKFYAKLNEDRARRIERQRAQRAEQEEAKKKEIVDRLRDEAEVPAFQAQIEDCQTLIDYFSGKSSTATLSHQKPLTEKSDVAGVPKLDIRKVDAAPEGMVARKKKGEDDEAYFVGAGKKKGGKKGGAKPVADANGSESQTTNGQLNVPLPTLTALLSLSIPPPTSTTDVPRVVDDLKTKKAWFEANQSRVTAENKTKAEAEIRKLLGGKPNDVEIPPSGDVPPAGGAERPAEPASTPAMAPVPPTGVPSEAVYEKLESVQEQATETS
uniref:Salicylate biosynthesis isochorismate synthase ) n=1 Tax=Ganoderma boninense TaxID=34458 RepID=A0A5K1JU18_9APHY|nr:Salicylate biosynthesis isochorismate synthase (EC (Isochorismate mutase) [Ganoderma boninense]